MQQPPCSLSLVPSKAFGRGALRWWGLHAIMVAVKPKCSGDFRTKIDRSLTPRAQCPFLTSIILHALFRANSIHGVSTPTKPLYAQTCAIALCAAVDITAPATAAQWLDRTALCLQRARLSNGNIYRHSRARLGEMVKNACTCMYRIVCILLLSASALD